MFTARRQWPWDTRLGLSNYSCCLPISISTGHYPNASEVPLTAGSLHDGHKGQCRVSDTVPFASKPRLSSPLAFFISTKLAERARHGQALVRPDRGQPNRVMVGPRSSRWSLHREIGSGEGSPAPGFGTRSTGFGYETLFPWISSNVVPGPSPTSGGVTPVVWSRQ